MQNRGYAGEESLIAVRSQRAACQQQNGVVALANRGVGRNGFLQDFTPVDKWVPFSGFDVLMVFGVESLRRTCLEAQLQVERRPIARLPDVRDV